MNKSFSLRGEEFFMTWNNIGATPVNFELLDIGENLSLLRFSADLPKDIPMDCWQVVIKQKTRQFFHWAPHLTPTEEYIIDRHSFRCPAIIVHNNSNLTSFIPDLEEINRTKAHWFMDLNAQKDEVTLGISNSIVVGHVLYKKIGGNVFNRGHFSFSFYIYHSNSVCDIKNPFKATLDFHWRRSGEKEFIKILKNNKGLIKYCDHTYTWAFKNWKDVVWQEFSIGTEKVGAPAFIVNASQSKNSTSAPYWREPLSIWNQAWFSSLRTASGLLRYAKRFGRSDLKEKAMLSKNLALNMKCVNGFFYSVISTRMENIKVNGMDLLSSLGWESKFFGNSNRNPFTHEIEKAPFHILDMSFTCVQMLRWYKELEKDQRLLLYVSNFVEKLLYIQDSDGYFPAWIDESGRGLGFLDKSPETSMSITLLCELYELTKDSRLLNAAKKSADAIIRDIIPVGRWEDFETYWSCSRWGVEYVGKRIERNDMYKQCNLSMFWTSEALLSLYELTNEVSFFESGKRVLDELLMTQAVWQPHFLKAPVFGGFSVMNCDGEWLDSRQSLFAELIIKYGVALNDESYIKRGISALVASFAMMFCPENPEMMIEWKKKWPFFNENDYGFMMENYAHCGSVNECCSEIGDFTIYDWGNGAASEAFMRISDHFGESLKKYLI